MGRLRSALAVAAVVALPALQASAAQSPLLLRGQGPPLDPGAPPAPRRVLSQQPHPHPRRRLTDDEASASPPPPPAGSWPDSLPLDMAALTERACTTESLRRRAYDQRCQVVVLRDTCVVQETFVVYDPALALLTPPGQPPVDPESFDVTDAHYWLRHMAGGKVADVADIDGADTDHDGEADRPLNFTLGGTDATVVGHLVDPTPVESRFAVERELEAPPAFNASEVAVVVWTAWINNMAESFGRVGPTMDTLFKEKVFRSRGAHFAVGTVEKLPADVFNEWYLAPYTEHPVLSLAEFSALSASRPHGACFGTVVLMKIGGGGHGSYEEAADRVKAHFMPLAPPAPWKTQGRPNTTRVLIETRPHAAGRQFLNASEAEAACNAGTAVHGIECRLHTFGRGGMSGFLADLSVLNDTDILVSHHGAGQSNCMFMPKHASMVEVHPIGFRREVWWYGMWWPAKSSGLNWRILYWGLDVGDPELTIESPQEKLHLTQDRGTIARDRYVVLQWEYLFEMLRRVVIPMNYQWEAYRDLYNSIKDPTHKEDWGIAGHVQYTWANGTLREDYPVWCAWNCKRKWGPGLGYVVPPAPPTPTAPPVVAEGGFTPAPPA